MKDKVNVEKLVLKDLMYDDQYEPFLEESCILGYLDFLKGEDRENYIKLEEKTNPIHFKKFKEENPEYFKDTTDNFKNTGKNVTDNTLLKLYNKGKTNITEIAKITGLSEVKVKSRLKDMKVYK